jgi:hypothetical protein
LLTSSLLNNRWGQIRCDLNVTNDASKKKEVMILQI